jgi:hypothetical protein
MSRPPAASAVIPSPSPEGVSATLAARNAAPAKDAIFAAIGLTLLSTAFFAMGDVTARGLTSTLPTLEVTWLRYFVFCLVVMPTVFITRGARAMHTSHLRLQIIRALAMAGSPCSSSLDWDTFR